MTQIPRKISIIPKKSRNQAIAIRQNHQEQRYNILTHGHVNAGHLKDQVVQRLSRFLGLPKAAANELLSGKPIVIKNNLQPNAAQQYQTILNQLGVQCSIEHATLPRLQHQPTKAHQQAHDQPSETQNTLSEEALNTIEMPNVISGGFSFTINLKLFLITTFVVLLPLLYIFSIFSGLIALQWHAIEHFTWLTQNPSSLLLLSYIFPLLCGIPLLIMLIKPLLAPEVAPPQLPEIHSDKDRLLLLLIEKIAVAFSANMPKHIYFTWQAEITSSDNNSGFNFYKNNYDLTIGLPLIDALDTPQLASLLALEISRFSKRPIMRITRLVELINQKFYQTAYGQDYWDIKLEQMSLSKNTSDMAIYFMLKTLILVSLMPIKIIHSTSKFFSHPVLVQSLLNRDRYSSQLTGEKSFRTALTHQQKLLASQSIVIAGVNRHRQQKQFIENLPQKIVQYSYSLPADALSTIQENATHPTISSLGKFPSLSSRINALSLFQYDGFIPITQRAITLLQRYTLLCTVATKEFYTTLDLHSFEPNRKLIKLTHQTSLNPRTYKRALTQHYDGLFKVDRYFTPTIPRKGQVTAANLTQLQRPLLEAIRRRKARYENLLTRYYKLFKDSIPNIDFRNPGLPLKTHRLAEAMERELVTYEALLAKHTGIALFVVIAKGDSDLKKEIYFLIKAQNHIVKVKSQLTILRHFTNQLSYYINFIKKYPENQNKNNELQLISRCRNTYSKLLSHLSQGKYPFQNGSNINSILSYFQHDVGLLNTSENCLNGCNAFLKNIDAIHENIMGRLASLALENETELGSLSHVKKITGPAHRQKIRAQA